MGGEERRSIAAMAASAEEKSNRVVLPRRHQLLETMKLARLGLAA